MIALSSESNVPFITVLHFIICIVPPSPIHPRAQRCGQLLHLAFRHPVVLSLVGGQFVAWGCCSVYVVAHERLRDRFCWQALCWSIELLALDPFQSRPESGSRLGATNGFLCCIPTEAEFESLMSIFSLCAPFGARSGPRSCIRVPSMPLLAAVAHGLSLCSRMRNVMREDGVFSFHKPNYPIGNRTTGAPVSNPRHAGASVRATTSRRNATWLILPVVICLSQRLSHACVSMN